MFTLYYALFIYLYKMVQDFQSDSQKHRSPLVNIT